jgi:hypothetical protein
MRSPGRTSVTRRCSGNHANLKISLLTIMDRHLRSFGGTEALPMLWLPKALERELVVKS